MIQMIRLASIYPCLLLLLAALPTASNAGEGFLAAVNPPRLELRADAGDRLTEVITIQNLTSTPTQYALRSSEWDFTETGQSVFSDALKPDSCRPWLRLERRTISVGANNQRRFRFELHVPEGITTTECRLAIFIEDANDDGVMTDIGNGVRLPVKGRIAVIVYVAIGKSAPQIVVHGVQSSGSATAVTFKLRVSNNGTATGRLDSVMQGRDARNQVYDAGIESTPILPGQTRELVMHFSQPGPNGKNNIMTPAWPVQLDGDIFWPGGKTKVSTVLQP